MLTIMTEKKRAITNARSCKSAPLKITRCVRGGSFFPVNQRKSACACGGACPQCQKERDLKEKFPVQSKLIINKPGDKYEKEAEFLADQVIHYSENQVGGGYSSDRHYPKFQMKHNDREYYANDSIRGMAQPIVKKVLRSPGKPLDADTHAHMESIFGHDFSQIRVHTNADAAASTQEVNARAYTVGRDIVFGAGQYRPGTDDGRRLIGHELVHTIQQGQTTPLNALQMGLTNCPSENKVRRNARRSPSERAPTVMHNKSQGKILQREILAYKREEIVTLPTFSSFTTTLHYSADADNLLQSLQSLIDAGQILATDDGRRVFFANRSAIESAIESSLSSSGYSRAADMADALADNHNVYVYSREQLTRLDAIIPAGRSRDVLERQSERLLTDYEKREARRVFGNSLNLNQIRLVENPVMAAGSVRWQAGDLTGTGRVRSTWHTIYYPPGSFGATIANIDFMPYLIHELTHSWQYQHGVSLLTTLYHSIFSSYDYGGQTALRAAHAAGRSFTDFNTEQQAEILRHYYTELCSWHDITAFTPFVNEVQGTAAS